METKDTANIANYGDLKMTNAHTLVQPIYHMISDVEVPYVKHLYSYKNIQTFKSDIDFFLKNYKFVDVTQLINTVKHQGSLPEYPLHLTFDDGFREMYDIIMPILIEKGVPATFFINKNFLDNKEMFYRNKASLLIDFVLENDDLKNPRLLQLFQDHAVHFNDFRDSILSLEYKQRFLIDKAADELGVSFDDYLKKERPYLTTEQVNEMISKGFHFGAHSLDHPKYSTLTLKEQLQQTRESMAFVQETFNVDYKVFAFPFNDLGVSQLFYKKIFEEGTLDLSFGTAEMIDDWHPQNLQRSWFEKTELDAENLLVRNYSSRKERIASNTNKMERGYGEMRTYNKAQLAQAIEENTFWKGENSFPITKYRARAHVLNPRASDTDILLLTMYDEDTLIGYLGVLPDIFYINGKEIKWGWFTSWWTNPEYLGKGIGLQMLDALYTLYNSNTGGSDYTELGQKSITRAGKMKSHNVLGKIYKFDKYFENRKDLEEKFLKHLSDDKITFEYITAIDNETEKFIENNRTNELTKRGRAELDWLLNEPWVIPAPFKDMVADRTFFSSTASRFLYQAIKIFKEKELTAFIILRIRDDKMTVPYIYFNHWNNISKTISEIIVAHAYKYGIATLRCFNVNILNCMNEISELGFEESKKASFLSNTLDFEALSKLHIQDGDSDNGFT